MTITPATYSFKNVQASISGPGGVFSIGSSAGVAEEGISTEMLEEKDLMTVGADGSIMHSLRASDAARLTIRLLKTSPVNAQLSDMYNFQKATSARWGQNTIVVSDTIRGDVVSLTVASFMRQPNLTYGKDGGMNEWLFAGKLNERLGTGTPVAA